MKVLESISHEASYEDYTTNISMCISHKDMQLQNYNRDVVSLFFLDRNSYIYKNSDVIIGIDPQSANALRERESEYQNSIHTSLDCYI